MRRRSVPPLLALFAGLALATGSLAGGWAQVSVTAIPADPPAGVPTEIRLMVLQHGQTAVSWPKLTVVATDAASGAVVRTEARADGPAGSYLVGVDFPHEGDWALSFESPDLIMDGEGSVSVVPAAIATTSATLPANPGPLAIAIAILIGVALLAVTIWVRSRGGTRPDAPVSART